MSQLKYVHIYMPVFVVLWLGLYLDSTEVARLLPYNQWLTTLLVVFTYLWIYSRVSRVIRQLMLYGLIVGAGGEILFSLLLGMYTYRLDNVPVYVPFGHAIIYAGVYYLSRETWVKTHRQLIFNLLYPLMIIYVSLWLWLAADLFGFICMVAGVLLFRRYPDSKLFFILMFFMIVYLELLGTHYQCWQWPSTWFDQITWITSANPPSGIGVFYFAFDAGCLWFYKHADTSRWRRFRAMQQ
ncbi:MAG: hypothetical protein R8K50_08990 [Mariprofundus sp.]